jgi:hypothetical protein
MEMFYKHIWRDEFFLSSWTGEWVIPSKCPVTVTYEEFEDTKGVIRIHISKKNRQHNDQKEKYKRTNSDLQNIHTELTIEQHENHLKPGVGSGAQEG